MLTGVKFKSQSPGTNWIYSLVSLGDKSSWRILPCETNLWINDTAILRAYQAEHPLNPSSQPQCATLPTTRKYHSQRVGWSLCGQANCTTQAPAYGTDRDGFILLIVSASYWVGGSVGVVEPCCIKQCNLFQSWDLPIEWSLFEPFRGGCVPKMSVALRSIKDNCIRKDISPQLKLIVIKTLIKLQWPFSPFKGK